MRQNSTKSTDSKNIPDNMNFNFLLVFYQKMNKDLIMEIITKNVGKMYLSMTRKNNQNIHLRGIGVKYYSLRVCNFENMKKSLPMCLSHTECSCRLQHLSFHNAILSQKHVETQVFLSSQLSSGFAIGSR